MSLISAGSVKLRVSFEVVQEVEDTFGVGDLTLQAPQPLPSERPVLVRAYVLRCPVVVPPDGRTPADIEPQARDHWSLGGECGDFFVGRGGGRVEGSLITGWPVPPLPLHPLLSNITVIDFLSRPRTLGTGPR